VGFIKNPFGGMIHLWTGSRGAAQGEKHRMNDLLIALAFIGMILIPALVAAKAGNKATIEEAE
jgi:hypothetical protein